MAKNFKLDEGKLMFNGLYSILGIGAYSLGKSLSRMTIGALRGGSSLQLTMFIIAASVMIIGAIAVITFTLGNIIGCFISLANWNLVCLFGNAFMVCFVLVVTYDDLISLVGNLWL